MLIYMITNQIDGKKYIGQTRRTLEERWREHLHSARQPSRHKQCPYLYAAMNKYGFENFSVRIIDDADSQEELDDIEELWISKLGTTDRRFGYNISFGGASPCSNPETRAKLSASLKGKPAWNKGQPMSPEHYANSVKARQKYVGVDTLTPDGRRRLRESKLGDKNPNFGGKSSTQESIEKRAEQLRGITPWNKGVPQTEEARSKMRGPRPSLSGPRPGRRGVNSTNYKVEISEVVIRQLYSMGFNPSKISKKLGLNDQTVRNRLYGWEGYV